MSSDIDWKLNHLSLFFESLIGLHNLVPHTNNQTDFILPHAKYIIIWKACTICHVEDF